MQFTQVFDSATGEIRTVVDHWENEAKITPELLAGPIVMRDDKNYRVVPSTEGTITVDIPGGQISYRVFGWDPETQEVATFHLTVRNVIISFPARVIGQSYPDRVHGEVAITVSNGHARYEIVGWDDDLRCFDVRLISGRREVSCPS